jgi:hypothetical protein
MTKRQQITFGLITGVIFILLYLFLALFLFSCPTENQAFALLVLISLGAAGFASAIAGSLNISHAGITAGGPIAMFVIVFLINPPALTSQDDDGCGKTINVTVYLDNLPFEFAKVSILEQEKENYTNSFGKASFKMGSPLPDLISVRIKSDAMTVDTVCMGLPLDDQISVRVKRRRVVIASAEVPKSAQQTKSNVRNVNPNSVKPNIAKIAPTDTVTIKSTAPKTPERGIIKIAAIKNYCVTCTAFDKTSKVVNTKNKCNNDSLYIVNYILGFTNASNEQGRQAECKWGDISRVSFEDLKKEPLAKVLVKFMQAYKTYCFNAARIQDWGGRKRGFTNLSSYGYDQIEQMLEVLKSYNVLETGTCSNAGLYSFDESSSPDISDFLR